MAENTGRIVAIIGALIGIVVVLLSLAMPEIFGWYRVGAELDFGIYGSASGELYLTAFGDVVSDPSGADYELATLVLVGGILVLAGGGLCIVGAITEMKIFAILGGLLMIVGPLMLIIELVSEGSEFSEYINTMADAADSNVFFGSYSYSIYVYSIDYVWGLWVGFFVPFAAGAIGIIGGASM